MTHQQTLKKATQKAIDGGWDNDVLSGDWEDDVNNYKIFIFNHDFAKALWGKEYVFVDDGEYGGDGTTAEERTRQVTWAYHLQQMVIADDPIKYLEKNI